MLWVDRASHFNSARAPYTLSNLLNPYRWYSKGVVNALNVYARNAVAILSGKRDKMVKSCCAVGCAKRAVKGCGVSFYRFPADADRKARWIVAINWQPTEHSWLCSSHFISGAKSDDPLSPDFVPSVFARTASPLKRKVENDLQAYQRRKQSCLSRREENKPQLLFCT